MMIRGFGRQEHGSRRFEEFDEDNEVDESLVGMHTTILSCDLRTRLFVATKFSKVNNSPNFRKKLCHHCQ